MLRIDPVIPKVLDGLQAEVALAGSQVHIIYRIGGAGYGPTAVTLNGKELSFTRAVNPYRTGGAEVRITEVFEWLTTGTNELIICLG